MDDNEAVGKAVSARLGREADMQMVGFLPSADDLIETVQNLAPDVVLLDIDMPGRNPLEALAELSSSHPETRIVMLSGHVRRELIDSAFAAGAWGYVSKNEQPSEVVAAVRRVMAGELAMSPEVVAALEA